MCVERSLFHGDDDRRCMFRGCAVFAEREEGDEEKDDDEEDEEEVRGCLYS